MKAHEAIPVIQLGVEFDANQERIKEHLLLKFGDSARFVFNSSDFPWDETNVVQYKDDRIVRDAKQAARHALVDRFEIAIARNPELCVHLIDMLSASAREKVIGHEEFNSVFHQSDPISLWNIIEETCSSRSPKVCKVQDDFCREVGGLKFQH